MTQNHLPRRPRSPCACSLESCGSTCRTKQVASVGVFPAVIAMLIAKTMRNQWILGQAYVQTIPNIEMILDAEVVDVA